MTISPRSWSLTLGAASIAIPAAFFTYQQYGFSKWAEQQGGLVCGMPIVAAALISLFAAALLSAGAVGAGLVAFRRIDGPRHWYRLVELGILSLPFVVGLCVWTLVLWA